MVTYNQRLRREVLRKLVSTSKLLAPQYRARVIKNVIMTPRKPNSARRKVSQLLILKNKYIIFARLFGQGGLPPKFALVLIAKGGYRDTPQVNFRVIRGALECPAIYNKTRRRSIFGSKRQFSRVNDFFK